VPENQPDWWADNERLRRELGLPVYQPPRFENGTPVYQVVTALEDRFDCQIRFGGVGLGTADEWPVTVDGVEVGRLPRRRDESGNVVYQCPPEDLRAMVEEVRS
jgi:hypothetical protein